MNISQEQMTRFNERIIDLFKSTPEHKRHYSDLSALKNRIEKDLYQWLIESKNTDDRIEYPTKKFKAILKTKTYTKNVCDDKTTAFRALVRFVWNLFDGDYYASEYLRDLQSMGNVPGSQLLAQMVAGSAIWPNQAVINKLQGNKPCITAARNHFCYVRDVKVKKNSILPNRTFNINGTTYKIKADDNTQANLLLKKAILSSWGLPEQCTSLFINFTACHVWDETKKPEFYLNLNNLILVPNVFAGLTDHSDLIKEIIRYKSQLPGPDGNTQSMSKIANTIYTGLKWR